MKVTKQEGKWITEINNQLGSRAFGSTSLGRLYEVLIVRTYPTGLLQGIAALDQIVTDCAVVGFQAAAVNIERKSVEALAIVWTKSGGGMG